jgi:hypothetical protein
MEDENGSLLTVKDIQTLQQLKLHKINKDILLFIS